MLYFLPIGNGLNNNVSFVMLFGGPRYVYLHLRSFKLASKLLTILNHFFPGDLLNFAGMFCIGDHQWCVIRNKAKIALSIM